MTKEELLELIASLTKDTKPGAVFRQSDMALVALETCKLIAESSSQPATKLALDEAVKQESDFWTKLINSRDDREISQREFEHEWVARRAALSQRLEENTDE